MKHLLKALRLVLLGATAFAGGCEDIPQRATVGERCDENTICRSGAQCIDAVCVPLPGPPDPRDAGASNEAGGPDDVVDAAQTDQTVDGATLASAGCADNTREGFIDRTLYPQMAGCAGGWTENGLVISAAHPLCGRQSGNDLRPGFGCSAEDLCADGWHVCHSLSDLKAHGFTSCEGVAPTGTLAFFATRQPGKDLGNELGTVCTEVEIDYNNVFGCGTFGAPATHASCEGLHMLALRPNETPDCNSYPPWNCGIQGKAELINVTKPGNDKGGVICCHNGAGL